MNNEQIVIFGSGGHGKVILDILLANNQSVAGFIDDDHSKFGQEICGYKILGNLDYLRQNPQFSVVLGIGDNHIRHEKFKMLKQMNISIVSAIHPQATLSQKTNIGQGVVIMAGAIVNSGAVLEDGVVVNTAATVDHDCILKKFSHIWPGANIAGTVEVGGFSYVGTGAAVIPNLKIGSNSIVGAGAVVNRQVEDNVTVVGVPAKVIKTRSQTDEVGHTKLGEYQTLNYGTSDDSFQNKHELTNIDALLIEENCTMKKAMQVIDKLGYCLAFVVNDEGKLVGALSDGDIRRAILSGKGHNDVVKDVVNNDIVIIQDSELSNSSQVESSVRALSDKVKGSCLIPIVDANERPVNLGIFKNYFSKDKKKDSIEIDTSTNTNDVKAKTVLVVGGAGYLGVVLVEQLLAAGYFVKVLDILLYGKEPLDEFLNNDHFELIVGDLRDIRAVTLALAGVDCVVNLAAIVGDPACADAPATTIETNYLANKSLAEACKYHQINRYIFASTCSVYGYIEGKANETTPLNPVSLYARTKIKSEEAILSLSDENFSPTIFRMSTLYGYSNRMRFDLVVNTMLKDALLNKKINVHGGGTQWRPLLSVDDASNAFIKCLEAPINDVGGEIFNVGSEEQNFQIKEIARIEKGCVPEAQLYIDPQGVDNRDYFVDFSKIRNILNFHPQTDLKQEILRIKSQLEKNNITDLNNPKYYNVAFLKINADRL